MAERIDYAESRRWTNYLTLDPLQLVQNVLGGGDVQRDRLAIADLELQVADLARRREEVAEDLAGEVVRLVLAYEEGERALELLQMQLETQQLQQAVMESSYRTGQGDTVTMLTVWQRTEALAVQLQEQQVVQEQTIQTLNRIVEME